MIKKGLFLAFLFFLFFSSLIYGAKNNYPVSITLSTQAAIDAFAATYPGLTNIQGDLKIGDFRSGCTETDITNLDGLQQLTGINGTLHIHKTNLSDLEGLENLQYINGYLTLTTNGSLESFNGLSGINSIGGLLLGYDNYILSNCDALLNLSTINGSVSIYCDGFTNLNGFSNITSIQGDLSIGSDNLSDLSGLSNLTTINGNLKLDENYSLININQLSNLVSVNGYLFINDNFSLENLNGLSNLTTINGCIYINQNNKLANIEGIANINPQTINYIADDNFVAEDIVISNNPLLTNCNVNSICIALGFNSTSYLIEGNGQGCYQSILGCLGLQCTALSYPSDLAQNIPVDAVLNWPASPNATGYKLAIGTTPGGTDILDNVDVGNNTSYDPVNNLPCDKKIYVRIIPYRFSQEIAVCTEHSFFTEKTTAVVNTDKLVCRGSKVTLNASGGVSYQWFPTNGLNNPDIHNPVASPDSTLTYTVTVINERGCSDTAVTTVFVNIPASTNISGIHESGNNFNDGMGLVNPKGGKTPYSYHWSNGKTTKSIINLTPGKYKITLTDGNNCNTIDSVTINKFICPTITINSGIKNNSCNNTCDGSVSLTNIANVFSPYTLNWSTGQNSDSLTNLCAGVYTLTVTDIKNCFAMDSFEVYQPDPIRIIVDSIRHYSQNSPGFILIDSVSGNNIKYSWTGPEGFTSEKPDIFNLQPGCYDLKLTDTISGCFLDTIICISNLTSSFNISVNNKVEIYPNPASGHINIDFGNSTSIPEKIILLDKSGREIISEPIKQGTGIHILDLANLRPGLFFLKFQFPDETKYLKLSIF